MPDSFDLVVIGAGSGGVAASRRAAAHGAKVAIIESSRVGGTCVIRGCVPKKLLMYAAAYGDAFREAAGYGWNLGQPHFEMARWAAAKAAETQRLEHIYRQLLAGSKVELIEGHGVIDGPQRVRVGERVLHGRHILIATGAAPVRDSIPGIEGCPTSDDLLDLQALPPKAAVIGGGFIALEFASMLARLGVVVSLFYRATLPLRGFDEDLRTRAAAALQAAGIELHPGVTPREVQRASYALWELGAKNLINNETSSFAILEDKWPAKFSITLRPLTGRQGYLTAEVDKTAATRNLPDGQGLFLVDNTSVGQGGFSPLSEDPVFFGPDPMVFADMALLDIDWVAPDWVTWAEALLQGGISTPPRRARRFGKFNFMPRPGALPRDALVMEAQLPLGPRKGLMVVRFLNKRLLLGVTDQQITLLTEEQAKHEPENVDFQQVMEEARRGAGRS